MHKAFIFFIISCFFYPSLSLTIPNEKENLATNLSPTEGGALLQFPRGRFQEITSPQIFRWSPIKEVDTLGLLIYKVSSENPQFRELLARYDFGGQVESANWNQSSFPPGEYEWVLIGYSSENVKPIYRDAANFEILAIKQLSAQTGTLGLQTGLSLGNYQSNDGTFEVSFDTTPTALGFRYQSGNEKSLWHTNFTLKNLVLGGVVSNTMELQQTYLFKLNGNNVSFFDYFLGPSLRLLQYPKVSTVTDTDVSFEKMNLLNPGVSFLTQYRFSISTFFYGEAFIDLPALGNPSPQISFSDLNWGGKLGAMYTFLWPYGVSGELSFKNNNMSFDESGTTTLISTAESSIMAYLFYVF